jgi:cytochrome c oxidase subunit 2
VRAPGTQPITGYSQASKLFRLIYAGALIAAIAVILLPTTNGFAGEDTPVVTIHARRYEFVPSEITISAGKPVKLVFIADDVAHGISVADLLSDVDIDPGEPSAVVITPSKAGDFAGECSRYCGAGHERMKFLIHVVQ